MASTPVCSSSTAGAVTDASDCAHSPATKPGAVRHRSPTHWPRTPSLRCVGDLGGPALEDRAGAPPVNVEPTKRGASFVASAPIDPAAEKEADTLSGTRLV